MIRDNIPGPQIEVPTIKMFSSLLNILIVFFSLLLIFTVIQTNFLQEDWSYLKFWKIKIIDTANAITILVSLLGLKIAQNTFIEGLKPFISYSGRKTATSKLNLENQSNLFWNVTIKNQGKGVAIIKNMSFRIALKNTRARKIENWTNNINAIRQFFEDNNIHEAKDYEIVFLSHGGSIGSDKSEITIFEIPFIELSKFEYIDIQIVFEGVLGHRYIKNIFCLPRKR